MWIYPASKFPLLGEVQFHSWKRSEFELIRHELSSRSSDMFNSIRHFGLLQLRISSSSLGVPQHLNLSGFNWLYLVAKVWQNAGDSHPAMKLRMKTSPISCHMHFCRIHLTEIVKLHLSWLTEPYQFWRVKINEEADVSNDFVSLSGAVTFP